MTPITYIHIFRSRPYCSKWPRPNPFRIVTEISLAISDRHSKAQPYVMSFHFTPVPNRPLNQPYPDIAG